MIEYHSITPANPSSAYGRSVNDPTANGRWGWSRRAHIWRQIDSLYAASPLGQLTAHATSAAPCIKEPCVVRGRHRTNERIDQGETDGGLGTGAPHRARGRRFAVRD
jgi:hypothetical protein